MTGEARTALDRALRDSVAAGEVPGVVAMAATSDGPVYGGAFGVRELGAGPAMTLDSVFRIASMTKAITSVAVMQLVEQGKLALDAPVPDIDPALGRPQVLEGFDAAGQPRLRPAKRPITLRHLLTHTAGFTYDWSNPNTLRYAEATGMPPMPSGQCAALCQPLAFDPGEKWEYGINIDWVGRIIETVSGQPLDAYLREHVCGPLGARLHAEFAAGTEWPQLRQRQLGRHFQQLFLARPGAPRRRAGPGAISAVRRPGDAAVLWPIRARRLRAPRSALRRPVGV